MAAVVAMLQYVTLDVEQQRLDKYLPRDCWIQGDVLECKMPRLKSCARFNDGLGLDAVKGRSGVSRI